MKHATSRELYDYWNRIRGEEPAPRRSDIEPGDIRRILADTFILEVADRERHFVRLAGTRVCALYGREIKGAEFLRFWADDDRQAVATLATAVCEDAAGAVVTASLSTAQDRRLTCEVLLLPLRHGGPTYDRILGSCSIFDRPYWFGTEPIVSQRISSLRLIWPDDRPRFMRPFPRQQAPDAPTIHAHSRRHGHLFVLDGGKE